MNRIFFNLCVIAVVLMSLEGCEKTASAPKVGKVKGKITLDGKPLAKVSVVFNSSSGIAGGGTNENGEYELIFNGKPGAPLGAHTVSINTPTENPIPNYKDPIPAKYNEKSTLTAEVKEGDNTFDFPLTTK